MNIRLLWAIVLGCGILINSSSLRAQDDYGLPSRAEKRVYHVCLYAHWIEGYCRFHAWGFGAASFRDCVIANDGCRCVIANGGYWGPFIDDACHFLYRDRVR
jgi:hypothetical protein